MRNSEKGENGNPQVTVVRQASPIIIVDIVVAGSLAVLWMPYSYQSGRWLLSYFENRIRGTESTVEVRETILDIDATCLVKSLIF